jgi:hypothetical protein
MDEATMLAVASAWEARSPARSLVPPLVASATPA